MTYVLTLLVLLCAWRGAVRYRAYITRITTSGYVPTVSPRAQRIAKRLVRFWCWAQLGKLEVEGLEKIPANERYVMCINHPSLLDPAAVYSWLPTNCRAIGAYEIMRKFGGLPGIVMTKLGCFPVDRSNGATVVGPAIDVVAAGYPLGLAPEGHVTGGDELKFFKHGVGQIAAGAYEKLEGKEPVAIVPVHLWYKKRGDLASARNYWKMGLKWRGGAIVTICDPIWLQDLNDLDPDHLTVLAKQAIANVQEMRRAAA